MEQIHIRKGLNVPITGEPEQVISEGNMPKKLAVLGDDYVGMKPTMAVNVGDRVKLGQVLFSDKKLPRVQYTSPGAGKVIEINRGEKRKFESVVIELEGHEEITFPSFKEKEIDDLPREKVVRQLIDSGVWCSLRSRPFGRVANPDIAPHSIFITAMDTNPLAPQVEKIVESQKQNFLLGQKIISKLTDGKLFVCKSPGTPIPTIELDRLTVAEFSGPHPAGLPGTHIHFLDPVGRHKTVWYIGAQDVIAMGVLFATGKLHAERIVALSGPAVKNPRLIRTWLGASLNDLVRGELKDGNNRVISGSVLSGHKSEGPQAYLGRFHQQISALTEGHERKFLGWLGIGKNLFSVKRILASSFSPYKKFNFTTSLNGGLRSIVPIGNYEKVMPLDLLPTYLLRAIAVQDVEESENLGCLELEEDDL
ncbi:MAG: Na(+)-translocating NADH-quinone reductase subunit A, partial [Calditrichaeota bacterium]